VHQRRLADGKRGLAVHSSKDFEDKMYPWFEPSTAPLSTDDLTVLLARPGVAEQVLETGVRYVVWVDGSTDRVASGGGITCAAGVGGAGCMGLAWWEDDSRYDLTVWDVKDIENEGTIYADYQGRSVMPAIVIPIPLITRPQTHACKGLTDQLRQFLTTPTTRRRLRRRLTTPRAPSRRQPNFHSVPRAPRRLCH
jgi:hypothetical protein